MVSVHLPTRLHILPLHLTCNLRNNRTVEAHFYSFRIKFPKCTLKIRQCSISVPFTGKRIKKYKWIIYCWTREKFYVPTMLPSKCQTFVFFQDTFLYLFFSKSVLRNIPKEGPFVTQQDAENMHSFITNLLVYCNTLYSALPKKKSVDKLPAHSDWSSQSFNQNEDEIR